MDSRERERERDIKMEKGKRSLANVEKEVWGH